MASFHSNQLRPCSKAQASLNKIIQTISSVKPPRRFDIDLNLSLVVACRKFDGDGDGEYENCNLDACSFVEKQIESGSSGHTGEKPKKVEEGSCSDITNSDDVVEETKEDHETTPFKEQSRDDCFGLLIAAAELISSTEADSSPSQAVTELLLSAGESTRGDVKPCRADVDDTSPTAPVVRSNRGRSQVLPYRYRDSVLLLEPYKRRRDSKTKRHAR